MKTINEPRAFCLSKSKRYAHEWDLIESLSMTWNMPYNQTIFRMAREYNQMKRWSTYNMQREER